MRVNFYIYSLRYNSYSSYNASTLLSQLRNKWNTIYAYLNRDVVVLFTGKDLIGSALGTAWTGVICNNLSYSYAVVQDIVNSIATTSYVTAHQIGHNLGAYHTYSGIMASGISIPASPYATFHPISQVQIFSHLIGNGGCLHLGGC